MAVHRFSKPIIACLDGIVMGGGVGLTYGASHRIVTERTKWAMPEMNIGFFPDVGAAYFLNKAPGRLGRYLGLTASVIHAADVLYINGADAYMESGALERLLQAVEQTDWRLASVEEKLDQLIRESKTEPSQESTLARDQQAIDRHFKYDKLEEILQSLESEGSTFSSNVKKTMLSKSPFSLKITLKQLADGRQKTLEECACQFIFACESTRRYPLYCFGSYIWSNASFTWLVRIATASCIFCCHSFLSSRSAALLSTCHFGD
ncbi:putative enoyl-CoA hydratase [Bacillus licheniformis]|nr:putative enoyl-CoA hydratase [Bacillus licheniformis]